MRHGERGQSFVALNETRGTSPLTLRLSGQLNYMQEIA